SAAEAVEPAPRRFGQRLRIEGGKGVQGERLAAAMEADLDSRGYCESIDLDHRREAATPVDVRLQNRVQTTANQLFEAASEILVLATSDGNLDALDKLGVAVEIIGRQRLFEERDVVRRNCLGDADGRLDVPHAKSVDHQRFVRSNAIANTPHKGDEFVY